MRPVSSQAPAPGCLEPAAAVPPRERPRWDESASLHGGGSVLPPRTSRAACAPRSPAAAECGNTPVASRAAWPDGCDGKNKQADKQAAPKTRRPGSLRNPGLWDSELRGLRLRRRRVSPTRMQRASAGRHGRLRGHRDGAVRCGAGAGEGVGVADHGETCRIIRCEQANRSCREGAQCKVSLRHGSTPHERIRHNHDAAADCR